MIPCTANRTRHIKAAASFCFYGQRWKSYDAASLSWEALTQKVEAGLGEDVDGRPLRVDAVSKTVATASGILPLSPVLDPAWIKAKRQSRKAPSHKPGGRFRKKLANNPYARALETPIRRCANTAVCLPRYFLQDFEVVENPKTKSPWWAPGPLAFKFVEQRAPLMGTRQDADTECVVTRRIAAMLDPDDAAETDDSAKRLEEQLQPERPIQEPVAERNGHEQSDLRPEPGPITTYALCRKAVIDLIGGPNRKYAAMLHRNGMAITPETRNAVWREDMGDFLLNSFRRHAVDALISRSRLKARPGHVYIRRCADWSDIVTVEQRGCVLWIPSDPIVARRQYATFEAEGAQYGNTMAVHNLLWLLGREELERLQYESAVFRHNEVCVMTQFDSIGMMRMHLLLWRLQGYLGSEESVWTLVT